MTRPTNRDLHHQVVRDHCCACEHKKTDFQHKDWPKYCGLTCKNVDEYDDIDECNNHSRINR